MPQFKDQKLFDYTPEQVFNLVADVARYPEFLPWCLAARIREQDASHIVADLIVGWKMIRESFTSRVQLTPHSAIIVEYQDGPFRYLHNEWRFKSVPGNKTMIEFDVDFEFRSAALRAIMDPLFSTASRKMVQAFEDRAKQLYG